MLKGVKASLGDAQLGHHSPIEQQLTMQQLWPASGAGGAPPQQSKDAASPTLSPSASFSQFGGPADQATPRASAQNTNPFDQPPPMPGSPALAKATSALTLGAPSSPGGGAGGANGPGMRTPSAVGGFAPMGTPGAAPPTTGVTIGDTLAGGHGGFGLHEPAKMRKALGSGVQTPQADGASTPTTDTDAQGAGASQSIRGTLNVKLIQARGLHVQPGATETQPYVVMQFEQNEFVSRTPHAVSNPSHVPFTTAQPQPLGRTSSGGLGSITRAFADAMGRGKGKEGGNRTPKPEEGWLGKPGLGDPIWKEEVTL